MAEELRRAAADRAWPAAPTQAEEAEFGTAVAAPPPVGTSCDVLIAGCGVAGLYAALNLPASCRIIMLSKGRVDECDSMLAQGGICVLPEAADYQAFFDDTLRAGHGENRRESVDIMIRSSRSVINDLVALGVNFEREPDGSLAFTREGAHSRPRICYQADITGREITTKLLAQVRRLPNVEIWEHAALIDLLDEADPATGGRRCAGGLVRRVSEAESTATVEELRAGSGCALGETVLAGALVSSPAASSASAAAPDSSPSPAAAGPAPGPDPAEASVSTPGPALAADAPDSAHPVAVRARATILACGGIGGLYAHSTNFPQLTGDACFLANEHGLELENPDYVQIHPTGLYSTKPGRTFLISESCRGEGAVLLDRAGERFCDELQPRDVVTEAIRTQMRADGTDHEWLSFVPVPREVVRTHFANIRAHCRDEEGIDILEEPIPVVPTQHYFMGGIHVDRDSATALPGLFAAGETSCNGVHGANRLASNSLLESLVFARRAAVRIATGASLAVEEAGEPALDGRHRSCGVRDASIDLLCGEAGTVRKGGCVTGEPELGPVGYAGA